VVMNDEDKYFLDFNCISVEEIDSIALKACQIYNYENLNNWFLTFRMGKIGFYSKLFGIRRHFREMHLWEQPNDQVALEYHIASVFFHMDSAIECFVFMLNALGYGIEPPLFRNINNEKELRNIFPKNITGIHKKDLVEGYNKYFPNLKNFMVSDRSLMEIIANHHDISKHRKSIFAGGKREVDSVKRLAELTSLSIEEVVMATPFKEIIMESDPKKIRNLESNKLNEPDKLEEIVVNFCNFINGCTLQALEDAKTKIYLKNQ
jgi:hypothetical protein